MTPQRPLHKQFIVVWTIGLLIFIAGRMFIHAFVGIAIIAVLVALGLGAVIRGTYYAFKLRTYRSLGSPLVAIALLASLMSPQAFLAGIYVRALIEVPGYRSAIEEKGPDGFPKCINRKKCKQDGQWIMFSWGGLIDNWSGVVYDSSDTISAAPEYNRDAFGGDLIFVRHLWGAWYYCGFT